MLMGFMSSPNFTTMLGARARAAEYNAYKAATARQASREAEEQKLPPKPSPISLSAFTRNPLSNRNKGNKTWVPLILEDTREVDVDDDDDDGHNPPDYHVMSTPSPSRQTSHSSSHGIDPTAKPPSLLLENCNGLFVLTSPMAVLVSPADPIFSIKTTLLHC